MPGFLVALMVVMLLLLGLTAVLLLTRVLRREGDAVQTEREDHSTADQPPSTEEL